ncbi:hypothetical protein BGZ65_005672 [Modicella reniformis]|uniref:Uncharacterized protein n=1 Tax=Modicella reniformis TaxID=1440133 RepID=A0A9P6IX44_9FUNG|nr:hypothetical protein BGZ65_005672 [Modicella reniformis]
MQKLPKRPWFYDLASVMCKNWRYDNDGDGDDDGNDDDAKTSFDKAPIGIESEQVKYLGTIVGFTQSRTPPTHTSEALNRSPATTIGNPTVAAESAGQKAQAQTDKKATGARMHTKGVGNTVQGNIQKTVGSVVGIPTLEAKGNADVAKGEVQKNI